MERSLVLIKPDAVERNLIGEIISIYEKAGLKVVNLRLEKVSKQKALRHYIEHAGRSYFNELITYITRSPLVAIELEGDDAIERIRALNGSARDPEKGSIRDRFAVSLTENSVHSSDSAETARRELHLWFND
ncbi:MAG: nucleoside-diphosphate kinase [Paraclostridium sp.]|uniref:nucleoside-diphosphate kinase n=1 Tax=Paraclostridium sp. TaxID=2023273 RepID=UPI003F328ACD